MRTLDQTKSKLKTNEWGIDLTYKDALGKWHETPQETVAALHAAMDAEASGPEKREDTDVVVLRAGRRRPLAGRGTVVLESGETRTVAGMLPGNLPTGYHQLQMDTGAQPVRLIVSPGKCWLPERLHTWGWAVQLYAARSRKSWGIGDLTDLKTLAHWSAKEQGAGMLLVNPLSAVSPLVPQQSSPYFPTSRRFFNPLWLNIEAIEGATEELVPELEALAKAGHELNGARLIDRDRVFELKMRALEALWRVSERSDGFAVFCQERGKALESFAIFCALAEEHGSGWHAWPAEYRHPNDSAVAAFAKAKPERVAFYQWVQWLIDEQLASCSREIALMQDLPIGVDPDGADAWAWQDIFTLKASVGAPPDEFNTQGQNWGLPPFVPHKLRAAGYEPFIETIRGAFRHGGGLRIDHAMGLFRLFWIPEGESAARGAYVRYRADEMLAILALESQRAHAYMVGEDLGTVEEGVREQLAAHAILSYRLLWFEKEHPSSYPRESLAAVSTHDLPTVAGMWTGSDLKRQEELGLQPNTESVAEICERLKTMAGVDNTMTMEDVVERTYQLLGKAPARILTASLEDALVVQERPNMPATTGDINPNWSLALPKPIEDLMSGELAGRIGRALGERVRVQGSEAS
jgi:4-alpha-glucanotransferase